MRYFIKTFGCQMNISDSERIASFLEKNNLKPAKEIQQANLVVLNTCGIRQMAEDRVFGLIRNLKKNNYHLKIIVTGCLANRKDIHRRMKQVDLFTEIKYFPENIKKFLQNGFDDASCHFEFISESKKIENYLSVQPLHQNKFQALIPIMTGCDNFCSYCVVPQARGREISRPTQEILDEIKSLLSQGYKSFVLLGQNVNSYQGVSDEKEKIINFAKLLEMINDLSGDFWIYFVSSHPKDMNDETIETITKLPKVCENIHLPVQSGNDEILQKMNRHYTQKDYLKLIEKIKKGFAKNKPGKLFSISSDIIVGFPGESELQFQDSAKVMEAVSFDLVFFGQYSRRPGTVAWKMNDDVSKTEKTRREKFLNEILKKTALKNNQKYLNQTVEVLVEKEKGGFYFGKTRTLKNVRFQFDQSKDCHSGLDPKSKSLVGQIIPIPITEVGNWKISGI